MRALRRNIAFLILAGFIAGQGAVWVAAHHAMLEDDAACAGVDGPVLIGPHHQAGIQFEETNPPSPIEHCAICHMQRVVSNARLARLEATHTAPQRVTAPVDPALAQSLVVIPSISPRGPPALLA